MEERMYSKKYFKRDLYVEKKRSTIYIETATR